MPEATWFVSAVVFAMGQRLPQWLINTTMSRSTYALASVALALPITSGSFEQANTF